MTRFLGEVINTKDVMTFQSDSAYDFKQAFIDSIEDYLVFWKALKNHFLGNSTYELTLRTNPCLVSKIH